MEKYSIEDYLNFKSEIKNIKSKKKDIEPQIEELQKQKSVLESNYNELQEHVVQIKALTELQRNLKLHQFAEKNRLKEKLENHYENISTIEININSKFELSSRHEIDFKIREIDNILKVRKRGLAEYNIFLLNKENKLKIIENNLDTDNLEEQFINLKKRYKNQGIRSKIEIINLKIKFK